MRAGHSESRGSSAGLVLKVCVHQRMRCSGIWAWGKGRGKRENGKTGGELGFAELKRANFSDEQVSTTSGIKRWISPNDKSRIRCDHLQNHGGLWTDGVGTQPIWAAGQRFALVPQEETLLTSRYLGLLLSCGLFTLNPVHHWRMIYAGITGPFLIHHKLWVAKKKSYILIAFAFSLFLQDFFFFARMILFTLVMKSFVISRPRLSLVVS